MRIWVDADACPAAIKEILFRAAERVRTEVVLVANQALRVPRSPYIRAVRVAPGFDVADNRIIQDVAADDLVVTADIPLAAAVISKGAHALSPRGESLTVNNIGERLGVRDFMEEMRSAGVATGGPPPLSQRDRQAFANALDRLLARRNAEGGDVGGPVR